ncbi:MAG: hypothetical protein QOJ44_1627 [Acidimicrobiaceae bacterium]|jgi:hypothetical protein|nr:hypothetical protein [Acidimicrobiaceae bacterium]
MNGLRTGAIVLAALGIFGLFALAVWVTWRVTRWFRRVHSHLSRVFPGGIPAPRPATATVTYAHMHRRTLGLRRMTSSGPRREALSLRQDLWSHVDTAHAALTTAQATGAPVGDLAFLAGQLRDLSRRHDQQLALLSMRASSDDLARARIETNRISQQADMVSEAAIAALHAVSTQDADRLALMLDHETQAVKAGSDRLRSLSAG